MEGVQSSALALAAAAQSPVTHEPASKYFTLKGLNHDQLFAHFNPESTSPKGPASALKETIESARVRVLEERQIIRFKQMATAAGLPPLKFDPTTETYRFDDNVAKGQDSSKKGSGYRTQMLDV